MFSPLPRLWIVVLCLLALTSLTSTSYAQNANVTTWHTPPTPTVSSNGTMAGTGIVWAIEHGNSNNPTQGNCNGTAQQAALHAFSATNLGQKLYNSRGLQHHTTGSVTTFSTPTIFNGQVYMATQTEVNVFGLCSSQPSGCPAQ